MIASSRLAVSIHRHVKLEVDVVQFAIQLSKGFVGFDGHDDEFERRVIATANLASVAISEVAGHGDLADATELHADNALVPAFDEAAGRVDWRFQASRARDVGVFVDVERGVEDATVGAPAEIVSDISVSPSARVLPVPTLRSSVSRTLELAVTAL